MAEASLAAREGWAAAGEGVMAMAAAGWVGLGLAETVREAPGLAAMDLVVMGWVGMG